MVKSKSTQRPAVVLLIVITMLALFAAVGLAFVYYADNESRASTTFMQAEVPTRADVNPELLLSYFLGQFLYGTDDVYSSMRGHSLAQSLYGWNGLGLNTIPFNGTGSLHYPQMHDVLFKTGTSLPADNYFLVNYTYWNYSQFNDHLILRDPECYGARFSGTIVSATNASPIVITTALPKTLTTGTLVNISGVAGNTAANGTWTITVLGPTSFSLQGSTGSGAYVGGGTYMVATPGSYMGGANVPWTYPDMQNMFLAAVNANGEVLLPSFHRPRLPISWNMAEPWQPENPNNVNYVWNKYLTLRPHPSYHSFIDVNGNLVSFPPSDEWVPGMTVMPPDVKNLEFSLGTRKPGGGHWMNDSYWMDLGFPVMVGPNGKKFKALFAPLIVDLDGKINLNIHGNLKGPGGTSSISNQGFARSEVNPERLLSVNAEYQKFLKSRYGVDGVPSGTVPAFNGGQAPFYSPFDFDGTGAPIPLPTQTTTFASCFPTFPTGYDSSSAAELAKHPAGWQYFGAPAGDDRRPVPDSNLEAIYRYRGSGSPALTSDLFKLLPRSFQNSRDRLQVTTRSMDLESPGASAWYFFDSANFDGTTFNNYNQQISYWNPPQASPPAKVYFSPYQTWDAPLRRTREYPYFIGGTSGLTDGLRFPFPPGLNPAALAALLAGGPLTMPTPYPKSEFGPDWRSTLAQFVPPSPIPKLNLNRVLPDYPVPVSNAISNTDPAYIAALQARQQFARDILAILVKVTGAMDPSVGPPAPDPTDPIGNIDRNVAYGLSLRATRYLAQLSVNIVDYIDKDDYITPFLWCPPDSTQILYGTELPRLVLNEAYAQLDNDPNDPGVNKGKGNGKGNGANYSKLNVWVELHNPFFNPLPGASYPNENSKAILQYQAKNPVYRVVVQRGPVQAWDGTSAAEGNANAARGELTTPFLAAISDWGTKTVVDPANGNVSGPSTGSTGFYVLGPLPDASGGGANFLAGADPQLPMTFQSTEMSIQVNDDTPFDPTLVLQRLACPHLPRQDTNPSAADYNPFVSVDVMNSVKCFENRSIHIKGSPPAKIDPSNNFTVGRTQPYAGAASQLKPQLTRANVSQPMNTFFWHNAETINFGGPSLTKYGATLKSPNFDWLVHMDRPLISPMELLQVSAYSPHLLTQKFVADDGTPFGNPHQHPPNWFGTMNYNNFTTQYERQDTLLYRFFEMVYTPDRMNPLSYRQPGKININTVFDRETMYALFDVPPSLQPQARAIYQKMVDLRSPGVRTGNQPIGPTVDDFNGPGLHSPFKSLATGYSAPVPDIDLKPLINYKYISQFPNGLNINNTILRDDGSAWGTGTASFTPPRLFEIPGQTNPYLKYQLLNKIFNNVTNRSNVFAVWVTVGFFEAYDEMNGNIADASPSSPIVITTANNHGLSTGDSVRITGVQGNTAANNNWVITVTGNTTFSLNNSTGSAAATPNTGTWSIPLRPAKLGKEIGRDEGRNVRHRMFAIVDRTQMAMPAPPAVLTTMGPIAAPGNGLTTSVGSLNGPQVVLPPPAGVAWQWSIKQGAMLVVDKGLASEETIKVKATSNSPLTITADFTKAHAAGATLSFPATNLIPFPDPRNPTLPFAPASVFGNPGPQGRFDHRNATAVVPHYSIIE